MFLEQIERKLARQQAQLQPQERCAAKPQKATAPPPKSPSVPPSTPPNPEMAWLDRLRRVFPKVVERVRGDRTEPYRVVGVKLPNSLHPQLEAFRERLNLGSKSKAAEVAVEVGLQFSSCVLPDAGISVVPIEGVPDGTAALVTPAHVSGGGPQVVILKNVGREQASSET